MPDRVTDKTLQLFGRFISRTLGLHIREDRLPELRQKVATLCRDFAYQDCEGGLLSLMSSPPSREQVRTLAASLTIGETYFLRDPASYQVLEQELLPRLIATRRQEGKRLKIWSAGCSSGEEPYSLALLLSRMLPDLAQWEISLLATDINPQALEKARLGRYSRWSFRDAPPWLMEYFTPCPDGKLELASRIREMVQFAPLNLAEENCTAQLAQLNQVDVIFCRNVLLYLEPKVIREVLQQFLTVLNPGGWLFVSPTEVDPHRFDPFWCRRFPGAVVFQKPVPGEPEPEQVSASALRSWRVPSPIAEAAPPLGAGAHRVMERLTPPKHRAPSPARKATVSPPAAPKPAPLETMRESEVEALERKALDLADRGMGTEAVALCEQAIALDRLRGESYYLLALVLSEQGEEARAEAALKTALYLDHDFLLASFALANLLRQQGRNREAARHFENALKHLDKRDPEEILPHSGGMTVAGLSEAIRSQRRMLHGR